MVVSTKPSDRLTVRQSDLRAALVELVLAEGFAHFRVEDVAARLGCSKRTLYALAPSKEQLATLAVRDFFRLATQQVESEMEQVEAELAATSDDPGQRVSRYLEAVAAALAPAGRAFYDDVAGFGPAHDIYEINTLAAASRVCELIEEGTRSGAFRSVPSSFVAEVVTATMRRIASGDVQRVTGLTDAQAYAELAQLMVAALRR